MSTFQKIKLADVAKVISGFAFKSSEFGDEGVPVLKIANIRMGVVETAFCQRVSAEHLKTLPDKYQVQRGDILISLTGSHVTQPNSVVGRVARMGTTKTTFLLNQRAGKIIVQDHERVDPDFLYFSLIDNASKGEIASMASGAASQANVSPTQVGTLQVLAPPLPTQQRIAAILSAYDDLIENNTRRIAILEEMARRLYEEWFVHCRLPSGCPTSVESARLLDLADIAYGKGLPSKHLSEHGDYPVYGAAKVIGRHTSFTEEDRTIIAGCRGSVGKFTITEPKCFVTNNSFTFKPKRPADFHWLYFALSDRGLEDVVSGSAQPQITLASLSYVKLSLPNEGCRSRFTDTVQPWMASIWNHHRKNTNLRAQRDLLLPKLVSGEIDVSGAEAALEAAE